jgi:hypothetical protein
MSERMRAAWRELKVEHRRWLLINAIVIAAIVNGVLNALIAWGSGASEDEIPLWAAPLIGGPSTIVDTVATLFILPFLTTVLITTAAWHEMREGKLAPLTVNRSSDPMLRQLPRTRARRGAYFGVLTVLLLGPAAVLLLIAFDYGDISPGDFVLYKTIFGVALGALVTPPIAIAALTDTEVAAEAKEPAEQVPSELGAPG